MNFKKCTHCGYNSQAKRRICPKCKHKLPTLKELASTKKKPKFKVGDTVKVKTYSEIKKTLDKYNRTNELSYGSHMKPHCGTKTEIKRPYTLVRNGKTIPRYELKDIRYSWDEAWLEPATTKSSAKKKKTSAKYHVKVGDIIERPDGTQYKIKRNRKKELYTWVVLDKGGNEIPIKYKISKKETDEIFYADKYQKVGKTKKKKIKMCPLCGTKYTPSKQKLNVCACGNKLKPLVVSETTIKHTLEEGDKVRIKTKPEIKKAIAKRNCCVTLNSYGDMDKYCGQTHTVIEIDTYRTGHRYFELDTNDSGEEDWTWCECWLEAVEPEPIPEPTQEPEPVREPDCDRDGHDFTTWTEGDKCQTCGKILGA